MKEMLESILFTEDEEEWGLDVPDPIAVLLTWLVGGAVLAIPVLFALLFLG